MSFGQPGQPGQSGQLSVMRRIPPEVLVQFLDTLGTSTNFDLSLHDSTDVSCLNAFSLTSRTWNPEAESRLYRHVTITSARAWIMLVRTFMARPELALMVETLDIKIDLWHPDVRKVAHELWFQELLPTIMRHFESMPRESREVIEAVGLHLTPTHFQAGVPNWLWFMLTHKGLSEPRQFSPSPETSLFSVLTVEIMSMMCKNITTMGVTLRDLAAFPGRMTGAFPILSPPHLGYLWCTSCSPHDSCNQITFNRVHTLILRQYDSGSMVRNFATLSAGLSEFPAVQTVVLDPEIHLLDVVGGRHTGLKDLTLTLRPGRFLEREWVSVFNFPALQIFRVRQEATMNEAAKACSMKLVRRVIELTGQRLEIIDVPAFLAPPLQQQTVFEGYERAEMPEDEANAAQYAPGAPFVRFVKK